MDVLVLIHSLLRWLVLLAAVIALVVGLMSWFGPGLPEQRGRQATLAFALLLDVQVLLGIVVWVSGNYWAGGERFFRFEHPTAMVLALVAAHVSAARARRTTGSHSAGRIRSIGVGISLLLILAGIPWGR